jgi:hypothetical protein
MTTTFAPLGDSVSVAVTSTDQRVTLPAVPTLNPTLRIVARQANMVALYLKLGNGAVTGSTTTSMRVRPGDIDSPFYLPIGNGETHLSIFCEGPPGTVILTAGRIVDDGAVGSSGTGGTSGVVSIKDFGAIGDGATNDNPAMVAGVAALNAGTIRALFIPPGRYVVSPGHTISRTGCAIYGANQKSSIFALASAGDFLTFENAGTTMRDVSLANVLIEYSGVSNPTTGRAIHGSGVDALSIANVDIYGCYAGVDLEGCISVYISDFECFSSSSWSAIQTGSFGLKIRFGGPTSRNSSSLFITNFAISGSQSTNRLQNAIHVQGCDTVWASNGHIGFSNFASLFIEPINNASAFILNTEFHNVYFDGGFSGDVTGANIAIFGSATPPVKAIGFTGCQVNIHAGYGINAGVTQMQDLRVVGCTFRENGKAAINVAAGSNVTIADTYFQGNNSAGGFDCIDITSVAGAIIAGNQVTAGTVAHPTGINIIAGTTNAIVANNVITGATAAFADAGTGTVVQDNQGTSNNRLGFTAGSAVGGSVTQITSKATSVTLNKTVGQVIMNAAALAGGATVEFNVNNSTIGAKDIVIPAHSSTDGGTAGSYRVIVTTMVAGTNFRIAVTNVSGGSLSEAVAINFVIIKGAAS